MWRLRLVADEFVGKYAFFLDIPISFFIIFFATKLADIQIFFFFCYNIFYILAKRLFLDFLIPNFYIHSVLLLTCKCTDGSSKEFTRRILDYIGNRMQRQRFVYFNCSTSCEQDT